MIKRILGTAAKVGLDIALLVYALLQKWLRNPIVLAVVKYGLGFALLGYLIYKNWSSPGGGIPGLENIWRGEVPVQWQPLGLAAGILIVSVLLTFVRWWVLVVAQDIPFPLPYALRLGLLGYFWSTLFPGSISGDAVKAYLLAREQRRRAVAVATVLIDRAVGLWALIWLVALLGSGFWLAGNAAISDSRDLQRIVLIAVSIVVGTVISWALLGLLPQRRADRFAGRLRHLPKVGHMLAELWGAVWLYRRQRKAIALALLLSLLGHVGFVLTYYFSAMILLPPDQRSLIPPVAIQFLLVPIAMAGQALPLTPGGVGIGEAFLGWLYAQLVKPDEELMKAMNTVGFLACFSQRVINWTLALTGYLVYLRTRPGSLPLAERVGDELEGSPADLIPQASPQATPQGQLLRG